MRILVSLAVFISFLVFSCKPNQPVDETPTQVNAPLDSLNALLETDSTNAQALYQRAKLHYNEKRLGPARYDIDRCVGLDENFVDAWLLRGEIYYVANQTRFSRDSWEYCAQLDKANVDCRMRLAELYYAVADYEESMRNLNEILDINSRQPVALFMKGSLLKEVGDTTNAILFIQQALDADPNYFDAYDMIGVLLAAQMKPLCIEYYKKALQVRPNSSDIYFKMGVFYQDTEQWNQALESYTRAVQLDGNNKFAFYNLGFVYVTLTVWDEGVKAFSGAILADEMYYQAYYGRAFCYESKGMLEQAKLDYEAALNINMDYQAAKEGLGRVSKNLELR